MIDTLRLARTIDPAARNGLGQLIERHGLAKKVDDLAPGGTPHRALWDAVAAGLLLPALARQVCGWPTTVAMLLDVASVATREARAAAAQQDSLFD